MTEIKNRATFGIPDLDAALDGGIPRGSLVLLEEDTGAKSGILQSKFVAEGLLNNEYCYIFNMEHPPQAIVNSLSTYGLEPEEFKSAFVDRSSNCTVRGTAPLVDVSGLLVKSATTTALRTVI
jgi:KaiC/GvpD/RAD55 family RecA-like ATPase